MNFILCLLILKSMISYVVLKPTRNASQQYIQTRLPNNSVNDQKVLLLYHICNMYVVDHVTLCDVGQLILSDI